MIRPCHLVYVSWGCLPTEEESHAEIARKLTDASTIFISELLINEYNKRPTFSKARTVIPGFIVGAEREGIAHTEDFFWRLAFSVARLQAASERLGQLTVAGGDQVFQLVSNLLLRPENVVNRVTYRGSGNASLFYDILCDALGVPIRRVNHAQWMQTLRENVTGADFDHPFLPVMKWFE
ncbi:hypothetical protein N7532_002623 [Penicillium argentinense]|uniref:Uncharacterized protein n=1 Tax=Penicillium argentinense TaxID=1131581 RepID=A0A9W9KLM7_9EURO|nr:uncharacterized protein N7532_002623 [Penicillium argentinense]KAJ5109978.1 hypothetical protein N7532_002623 [Penicillium argentinense]